MQSRGRVVGDLLFTQEPGEELAHRQAVWERNSVALRPRPDQLLGLAEALNVSVEDLVGANETKKRGTGPTGKMKQLFEAASRLPRSQQQKLAAIIEPFITHKS